MQFISKLVVGRHHVGLYKQSFFFIILFTLLVFSTEGTGQNFVDEDNQSMLNSNSEFQAKKLKIAIGGESQQDQVMCRVELWFAKYIY